MERHVTPTLNKLREFGRPPEEANPVLEALGRPHVDSFDWMMEEGLDLATKYLEPMQFAVGDTRHSFHIKVGVRKCPESSFNELNLISRAVNCTVQ
jgi:hypothetical protein